MGIIKHLQWVKLVIVVVILSMVSTIHPQGNSSKISSYWKDRIFYRREFHEPLKLIPLEMRYGAGYYGGAGYWWVDTKSNWIRFDQPVQGFDGGSLNGRIFHAIDLDIFKTNLSHFILKTSWADLLTGLNIRYVNLLYSNTLPITEWGQTQASWNVGSKQFAPRILSLGLAHSLNLQWYESWFIQASYTFGLATSKFYKTSTGLEDNPSGWGTSVTYSVGIRYILDPGLDNRFSVGLEFQNGYTKINRITDNGDVTPIKGFTLQDFGIRLSLSAFYGGQRTSGDLAKSYFYRGDYITARENFATFIKEYPNHANRYRAERFLNACNAKIPEQLFAEGLQFEERKKWINAVERFKRAKLLTKDQQLKESVDHHLQRIARLQLNDAELLLDKGSAKNAYQIVVETSSYSTDAKKELNRFHAEALLADAQKAMDHDLIYDALDFINNALELYPDFAAKSSALRYRAASYLISDANAVNSSEDIIYAIYSLENAKKITGDLGEKNEKLLAELRDRLALVEENETRSNIARKTNEERQKLAAKLRGKIEIGMTIPEIQDRLGEPHQIKRETLRGENVQLWTYTLTNGNQLFLTFREFVLFKIEEK